MKIFQFLADSNALVYLGTLVVIIKLAIAPTFDLNGAAALLTVLLAHGHIAQLNSKG